MANPTIPGMRSKMLTGGLLFMPAMFQHFGMNSMNKLPETEPQKAWIPSHMRRPWEAPEWNAMPVDTGRKAYIIPNFLSDAEVDHIMYNVVRRQHLTYLAFRRRAGASSRLSQVVAYWSPRTRIGTKTH